MKPMTAKIKTALTKSSAGIVTKLFVDFIVQDCNIQISKNQYESILTVADSLNRMLISWNFLAFRPTHLNILDNKGKWWKYAYAAVLEQRVRPYSWSRIKSVRKHYKNYVESYKQIILNPNDTELKMDMQLDEDNLSVVSIVVARQQARLWVIE